MNRSLGILAVVAGVLLVGGAARAEVKVTISKTHLCCPACFAAVDETMKKVEGVTYETSKENKTITIKAADEKGAKTALDALAKAGFHGKTDVETLAFEKVKTPEGAVKRLEVSGIHNCCGQCTTAIKKAVEGVKGVAANSCKARETTFAVEGDFIAADLVAALLAAGFHCQVK